MIEKWVSIKKMGFWPEGTVEWTQICVRKAGEYLLTFWGMGCPCSAFRLETGKLLTWLCPKLETFADQHLLNSVITRCILLVYSVQENNV